MLLDNGNKFLLGCSGFSGKMVAGLFDLKKTTMPGFFKPWKSVSDVLYRTSSIIAAPICLALVGLEFAVLSVYFAVKSLVDLVVSGSDEAKITFLESCVESLRIACLALCSMLTCYLVNAVDLIGGGVTAVTGNCCEDDRSFSYA